MLKRRWQGDTVVGRGGAKVARLYITKPTVIASTSFAAATRHTHEILCLYKLSSASDASDE